MKFLFLKAFDLGPVPGFIKLGREVMENSMYDVLLKETPSQCPWLACIHCPQKIAMMFGIVAHDRAERVPNAMELPICFKHIMPTGSSISSCGINPMTSL